jgi:hypothetical protein
VIREQRYDFTIRADLQRFEVIKFRNGHLTNQAVK